MSPKRVSSCEGVTRGPSSRKDFTSPPPLPPKKKVPPLSWRLSHDVAKGVIFVLVGWPLKRASVCWKWKPPVPPPPPTPPPWFRRHCLGCIYKTKQQNKEGRKGGGGEGGLKLVYLTRFSLRDGVNLVSRGRRKPKRGNAALAMILGICEGGSVRTPKVCKDCRGQE